MSRSKEEHEALPTSHHRRMKALDGYPAIRKVFDDSWAGDFLKELIESDTPVENLGYPGIYLAPDFIPAGFYPSDYLDRAEHGLRFILDNARKRNRTDLIGNLRTGSSAAVFEVMLASALASRFGEGTVETYPLISAGSTQTVDFGVDIKGALILIEAITIFDDQKTSESKAAVGSRYGVSVVMHPTTDRYAERVYRILADKVSQRPVNQPLVLCANQYAYPPGPDEGAEAVGRLVGRSMLDDSSQLVAVAYFWNDWLATFQTVENRAVKLGVLFEALSQIRVALCAVSAFATEC